MEVDPGNNIRRHAIICKKLFETSPADAAYAASICSTQGDFNLWCSTIRATSEGKSSLDYRLRNHEEVRRTICRLLASLASSLQICQERVTALASVQEAEEDPAEDSGSPVDSRSADSWGAISEVAQTADLITTQHLSYVKIILDQLARISLAIRRAGTRYRYEKIDAALDRDAFQDFRSHLARIIHRAFPSPEAAKLSSAEKISQASNYDTLTDIQKRLVDNNVLRKHRIEFIMKSRRVDEPQQDIYVVGGPDDVVAPAPSISESSKPFVTDPERAPAQPLPEILASPPTKLSVVSSTGRTATDVGPQLDINRYLSREESSRATNLTRIGSAQQYPACPKVGLNERLVCPYCHDVLPTSYAEHKPSWNAHVAGEILPYSCFLDGCDSPNEMYPTSGSLLTHVTEKHSSTVWACIYCSPKDQARNSSKEKIPVEFNNAEEWEAHVGAAHPKLVPARERSVLAELAKRQVIGPLSCPLCDVFKVETRSSEIHEHILQHLNEFALWALPDSPEAAGDKESGASQVSGSLSHTGGPMGMVGIPIVSFPLSTPQQIRLTVEALISQYPDAHPIPSSLSQLANRIQRGGITYSINRATDEYWASQLSRLNNIQAIITAYGDKKECPDLTYEMIEDFVAQTATELLDMTDRPIVEPLTPKFEEPTYLVWKLPDRNHNITDREDIIVDLDGHLFTSPGELVFLGSNSQPQRQSRVALTGGPGVGKTAIALEVAHQAREERPHLSIFWINARDKEAIEGAFKEILKQFYFQEGPVHDTSRSLGYFLTWVHTAPWFMVLDGIGSDSLSHLVLNSLLPNGLNGSILVTTRDKSCLALLGLTQTISVPPPISKPGISIGYQYYPITGIKDGWGPNGKVPIRRDFDEWSTSNNETDKIQFILYLLALMRLQNVDPADRNSYFQIAGIHGYPHIPWDEPFITQKEIGKKGYSVYADNLFLPWHRLYMLLYEQRLYEIMVNEIIPTYSAPYRNKYFVAAQTWRLPFWDWAKNPRVPLMARYKTIAITLGGNPKVEMANPLYQFRMPNNKKMKAYGVGSIVDFNSGNIFEYGECFATSRCPDKEERADVNAWANGPVHDEEADKMLATHSSVTDANYGSAAELVYRLLTYPLDYPHFATLARDETIPSTSKVTNDINIEFVHNIHYWVGGNGGHMSQIPVAAFDPMFWLHYCNIDRLFAIWQSLNPDKWFEASIQKQKIVGSSTLIINETPLRPFHKDTVGTVWTPADTRNWFKLGYTYPELVCGEETSAQLLRMVNDYYGISRKEALTLAQSATDLPPGIEQIDQKHAKIYDYALSISYSKFALGGCSFNIEVFLRPKKETENTFRAEDFIANVFNFSQTPENDGIKVRSNNKDEQAQKQQAVAYVPLTSFLLKMFKRQQLKSMEPPTVKKVLARMYWRIVDIGGATIPKEDWKDTMNLRISVSKTQMLYSSNPEIPTTFSDPEVIENLGTGLSEPQAQTVN